MTVFYDDEGWRAASALRAGRAFHHINRPRLRTRLGPAVSLDAAPGIIVRGSVGFSGQVALKRYR